MKRLNINILGILLLLLTACSQEPAKINYNSDECAQCRMMIMDSRFATQAVTSTGKAIKFDSIECLASYIKEHKAELEDAKYWVNNFRNPGSWVKAEQAEYVKSEVIKSPMGRSLLALKTHDEVNAHLDEYPGKELSWEELLNR